MEKFDFEKFWQRAFIILANYHSGVFPVFGYQEVQSRYLVWCISGGGKIEVNGKVYRMFPGKTLFIPWNHHITYLTDPQKLYRLGCIHIIPDMEECPDEPLCYNPYHKREVLQKQYYLRHDEYLPGFEEVMEMDLKLDHPLLRLGSYIIDRFQSCCPESLLHTFPRLLLFELFRLRESSGNTTGDALPEPIRHLINICFRMVEDHIDMEILKNNSKLSTASVYRLFQKYTGMSPGKFIMNMRLEHSTRMLKNSNMSINEISARLHFNSPFYFSKCFKDRFGMSPREYRNSADTVIVEPQKREWSESSCVPIPKKFNYSLSERVLSNKDEAETT